MSPPTQKSTNPSELDTIDEFIRSGRLSEARAALQDFARRKAPERSQLVRMAQFYRRLGMAQASLRLLVRIVRPRIPLRVPATLGEQIEYAAALIKTGASQEGLGLLAKIDEKASPEVLVQKCFGLISQWRYAEAAPLWEKYLRAPGVDDYAHLVGRLNLAAAYCFVGDFDKADPLLDGLINETAKSGRDRLHINALQQASIAAIEREKWRDADKLLGRASSRLQHSDGVDAFYVRKWRAVLDFLRDGSRQQSSLDKAREESVERQLWESARSCDYYQAIRTKNKELVRKLVWGTPHTPYNEMLLRRCEDFFDPASDLGTEYEWRCPPATEGTTVSRMNLFSGEHSGKGLALKPGQILHRLVQIFARDFYRPITLVGVHSALFPDRFYNPYSSSNQVHQNIDRLRRWLKDARLPLSVSESEGFYRLTTSAPCLLELRKAAPSEAALPLPVRELIEALTKKVKREFSLNDALEATGLPRRTLVRHLGSAVKAGLVKREGKASLTRYRFVK